tara:strand:+ start:409 stop:1272 length:864 start_codon:yes stop_codon:yes gene_type:complete
MIENFVVFILTYGRPDNVKTYKTLKRFGYTGKIYLICSDDDKQIELYKNNYKNEVIVFSKDKYKNTFDIADNFKKMDSVIYARNACFDIAKDLGIKYFLQLDDDYTDFSYRFNDKLSYNNTRGFINKVDYVFLAILNFYKKISAKSIAISQNGDWIGGKDSGWAKDLSLKRKCMNSFFCSTERPFKFIGRMNDDVNTYTRLGTLGDLFLTIPNISLKQTDTQSSQGGLTEMYLSAGTYVKSFYSVMFNPSSVSVFPMGTHQRLHHRINWNNTVPKILNEKHKKNGTK